MQPGHWPPGADRERIELELAGLGENCSTTERRAEAAERMAVLWKTIHYLEGRVGESFDGTVSGVTEAGLFVQIDEFKVDGLVHISELVDDFYHFEEGRHRLVGDRNRRVWRLGDRIRVQLAGANAGELRIEIVPGRRGRKPSGREAGAEGQAGPETIKRHEFGTSHAGARGER